MLLAFPIGWMLAVRPQDPTGVEPQEAVIAQPPTAQGSDSKWKFGSRGIEFTPSDDVHLRLGGRFHYHVAEFDPDVTELDDTAKTRRLRWSFSGDVLDDWRFYVERDEGGTSEGWKELWLRYAGFTRWEINAGKQVAPFSLDEVSSSDDTLFVERALPNVLAPGLYEGVAARTYGERWFAAAGVFGNTFDSDPKNRSEGVSLIGRVASTPVKQEDGLL